MGLPRAIAAVVRREDGRYLVIRRGPGVSFSGYWTPLTGRVEPGESLEEAVAREALEEVGLHVRAGREVFRCRTAGRRFELIWFEALLLDPLAAVRPLVLKPDEVAEARWRTAAEAARLDPMFDDTRGFFARLAAAEGLLNERTTKD